MPSVALILVLKGNVTAVQLLLGCIIPIPIPASPARALTYQHQAPSMFGNTGHEVPTSLCFKTWL